MFALVFIAALATSLVSQPGSPLRNTSQIAAGGASVALILLFVRGEPHASVARRTLRKIVNGPTSPELLVH